MRREGNDFDSLMGACSAAFIGYVHMVHPSNELMSKECGLEGVCSFEILRSLLANSLSMLSRRYPASQLIRQ